MAKLKLYTATLKADLDARTLTGTALPYGEPGRTSLGRVTASKGSGVKLADRVVGNLEHDRTRPVATMVASDDTDAGLVLTFSVAKTRAGDDLLEEAKEGLRTGLSVEVVDPVIQAGALVGGLIDHVAFCTDPAFDSARLTATAEDIDPADDDEDPEADPEATDDDTPEDDESEDTPPAQATAPKGHPLVTASRVKPKGIKTVAEFVAMMQGATKSRRLLAALSDITQTGVGSDVVAQGFLGELWSGLAVPRIYVPAATQGNLTSWETRGWRWVTKPTVGRYAGDKADIPSAAVTTEDATWTPQRFAGGHDIDRRFYDFPDGAEFLASYLRAMTESYALESDLYALEKYEAWATDTTPGTVPTGGNAGSFAILDAILAVKASTRALPSTVFVGSGIWREYLGQRTDDTLALLAQTGGLDSGSLANIHLELGGPEFDAGAVLAVAKPAVRALELAGSPIRVSAENIAEGGRDEGLFGYLTMVLDNPDGLVKVTATPTSINAGADFGLAVGAPDHEVTVLATGPDGGLYDVTDYAVLTSATPAKATIVDNKVHAVAAGTSVITATYGTRTDTTTVTVS